jgi:D-serine deaminase-like pyridoxal phosphate-dependent protein
MINLKMITRPSLILDEEKCRANIRMMAGKAKTSGVVFRPHFKTHQSAEIGTWFREAGVKAITVSSFTMANHFAGNGWDDITVAFPMNVLETGELRNLSKKAEVNVLISSFDHLQTVDAYLDFQTGSFFKVDTGLKRSGTVWNDQAGFMRMFEAADKSKHLRFKGILTHSGHSYKKRRADEVAGIFNETVSRMKSVLPLMKEDWRMISVGDTPGCSIVNDFTGVDEIRPGNFVFYDLMQINIGSCRKDQVAVAVACPVVDKIRERREIIIYGGGVHLSKDSLTLTDGRQVYGIAVYLSEKGWVFPENDSWVRSISQEHGIIAATPEFFNEIRIGDRIGIIPVHSCMTADLLRTYHTTEGRIIDDFSPK